MERKHPFPPLKFRPITSAKNAFAATMSFRSLMLKMPFCNAFAGSHKAMVTVFRSCWQARSDTHQCQFLRLPRSDLSCGKPEIRMCPNGFRMWPNRFPYVASHECWRQYYVEMTPIHTTIDAKTNMKWRQYCFMTMDSTPFGRGAKTIWPWRVIRLCFRGVLV